MPLADPCSFWLDLCLTCLELIFLHMDGVVHFTILLFYLCLFLSVFLWITGMMTVAVVRERNSCIFYLRPFMIKIMYMEKLEQSSTFPYRYQQMIALNSAKPREGCSQTGELILEG